MKKLTANDGTFWVSLVKTKEGMNVAFCYAWESATDKVSAKIAATYPNYFGVNNGNDLWMRPEAENSISLNELKNVISMDETDSIILIDFDTKTVISGVQNWLDINSFKEL